MKVVLAALFLSSIAFSQEYYETSGRTVPFLLAAGSRAAWDDPYINTEKKSALSNSSYGDLFPVPAVGCVFIRMYDAGAVVEIFTVNGKKITSFSMGEHAIKKIDTSSWANGVYFAAIKKSTRSLVTKRFMIIK